MSRGTVPFTPVLPGVRPPKCRVSPSYSEIVMDQDAEALKTMSVLEKLLSQWRDDLSFRRNVTRWETIPAQEGLYSNFPDSLRPPLREALQQRGIDRLYSHQAAAIEAAGRGDNVVVVTPTASGKTLCYNLPVINECLEHHESRALYLFPTKALSQDQVAELKLWRRSAHRTAHAHLRRGYGAGCARRSGKRPYCGDQPDMLHTGFYRITPNGAWLFRTLNTSLSMRCTIPRCFGSHVANVIRRLKRICRFYGRPQVYSLLGHDSQSPELPKRLSKRR